MAGVIVPNKEFFRRRGIRLRKDLGQHFLLDRAVAEKIVRGAELEPCDTVVEIGAGVGNLTAELAERAGIVHAVEYDDALVRILEEQMAPHKNVQVVHADALHYDLAAINEATKVKVVGNLPYSIATALVLRLVGWRERVRLMVLMLQKEVADRLTASPSTKAYGALSITVQLYMCLEKIASVPRQAFFPAPKVDSVVVKLVSQVRPAVQIDDPALYFSLVRTAFAHRRKTLWNNLKAARFLEIEPGRWLEALRAGQVDPSRRGETLSLREYADIANALAMRHGDEENS